MGRLATPTEELNGPTTPKTCWAIIFLATVTPVCARALSSALTNLIITPSTPPEALIWVAASWAPRHMSMPVEDCEPVSGASTAIRPGVNFFAGAADDGDVQPTAISAE